MIGEIFNLLDLQSDINRINETIKKFQGIDIFFAKNKEPFGFRYDSFFQLANYNELHAIIRLNWGYKISIVSAQIEIYGTYTDNGARRMHQIKGLTLDVFYSIINSLKSGTINKDAKSVGLKRCSYCNLWHSSGGEICTNCFIFTKLFRIHKKEKSEEQPCEEAFKDENGWKVKINSLGDLIEFIDRNGDIILSKRDIILLGDD